MARGRRDPLSEMTVDGCLGWMLAIGLVVVVCIGIFVIPAAFVGHLLQFTPSINDVFSGHNLNKRYPLVVVRFAILDVGIGVVLIGSALRWSASRRSKPPR
jgi:hypothetical protein